MSSVFVPCFVVQCFVSFLADGEGTDFFTLFVFLVSCDSYCFVGLCLDAVGWYAVSNYGIS